MREGAELDIDPTRLYNQYMSVSRKLDSVGSIVSLICAIHCFFTPLLIVLFPVAIADYLGDSAAHYWLVIASIALAFTSIIVGHKKHKNYNIFILPIVAALLFTFTAHQHNDWNSSVILAIAALILVATHLLNRRLCEHCEKCVH